MNTDIKQAMHVEAGKSFGTAEAGSDQPLRQDQNEIEFRDRS